MIVNKIIIRDEKGTEEILHGDQSFNGISYISIIWLLFIMWMSPTTGTAIFFVLSYFFIVYFTFKSAEKFTFDKGIKCIILEKLTVSNKKLEWKEAKTIKFSEIKNVNVEESNDGEGTTYYTIKLIMISGDSKTIWNAGTSEIAKESAKRLCKVIGVDGNYIFENNNSIPLIGAYSKPDIRKYEPESEATTKDLHHQTLSLEQGWEG